MTLTLPAVSEGFLLDEDNALRNFLRGLTVSDGANHNRDVGVWFSHPDLEVREQKYPYMIITLLDISEATNRVMAGHGDVTGIPMDILRDAGIDPVVVNGEVFNANGLWNDAWSDSPSFALQFIGHYPLPTQIDYQIRAFSRHPRHSRDLFYQFLSKKVPYRYGELDMMEIDGSYRRLELLDVSHGEQVEGNKRLFISSFTLRVDSWMPYGADVDVIENAVVVKIFGQIRPMGPDGYYYSDPSDRYTWYIEGTPAQSPEPTQ